MPISEAEEEVNKIMEEVDANMNGYIDYSEFIMAALNRESLLTREYLKAAF